MTYTPGPWQMIQEDKGRNELSRQNHGRNPIYRVESANFGHGFVGYFRRKRDAILAAAAPELYEAVQTVDMALAGQKTSLEEWANISKTVRAALTKARGEAAR